MIRKIVPELAARLMGKDAQFIRIGLQRGLLPFGHAVQTVDRGRVKRYSYYISPGQFMSYTGFTEADILAAAKKRRIHNMINIETLNKKFADLTVALIDDIQIVQDELGLQEIKPEYIAEVRDCVALLNHIQNAADTEKLHEELENLKDLMLQDMHGGAE